jgi:hypothetical protein
VEPGERERGGGYGVLKEKMGCWYPPERIQESLWLHEHRVKRVYRPRPTDDERRENDKLFGIFTHPPTHPHQARHDHAMNRTCSHQSVKSEDTYSAATKAQEM